MLHKYSDKKYLCFLNMNVSSMMAGPCLIHIRVSRIRSVVLSRHFLSEWVNEGIFLVLPISFKIHLCWDFVFTFSFLSTASCPGLSNWLIKSRTLISLALPSCQLPVLPEVLEAEAEGSGSEISSGSLKRVTFSLLIIWCIEFYTVASWQTHSLHPISFLLAGTVFVFVPGPPWNYVA